MIKKYTLAPLLAALLISTPSAHAGLLGYTWNDVKATYTSLSANINIHYALPLCGALYLLAKAARAGYVPTHVVPSTTLALASIVGFTTAVATTHAFESLQKTYQQSTPARAGYTFAQTVFRGHPDAQPYLKGIAGGANGAVAGYVTYKMLNHYL